MPSAFIHQVPVNTNFEIDQEGNCHTIFVKHYGRSDFVEIKSDSKVILIHKDQIEPLRELLSDCEGIFDLREQLEEQSKSDGDGE